MTHLDCFCLHVKVNLKNCNKNSQEAIGMRIENCGSYKMDIHNLSRCSTIVARSILTPWHCELKTAYTYWSRLNMNLLMREESVFKCFINQRVLVVVISILIGHLIDVLKLSFKFFPDSSLSFRVSDVFCGIDRSNLSGG